MVRLALVGLVTVALLTLPGCLLIVSPSGIAAGSANIIIIVKDTHGGTVAGAAVTVISSGSNDVLATGRTDASGQFAFQTDAGGSAASVAVTPADRAGATSTAINLPRSGTATFTVNLAGG